MGSDKGLLPLEGKPFVAHIIEALKPLVNEIMIVSDNTEYDQFGVTRIEDLIKDAGPLAGLYSGLAHSKTEENLVMSCDVPLIDIAVLKRLVSENEERYDAIQVQSQEKTMPLIALYKKRIIPKCKTLLDSGERRLRFFVSQLETKTIVLDPHLDLHTTNVNTPEDLKRIENAIDH